MTNTNRLHVKGDEAEFTGRVLQIHGGTFYEVKMLDGHLAGQLKVVSVKYAAMYLPYLKGQV